MEDLKTFRYNIYGEFLLKEGISFEDSTMAEAEKQSDSKNPPQCIQEKSEVDVDDSLMDFINEYFQGDVTNDFTILSTSDDSPYCQARNGRNHLPDSSSSSMMEGDGAFPDSSTLELFTSPESSLNIPPDRQEHVELKSELVSPSLPDDSGSSMHRRRSISYEIRFLNGKEAEGKVKIEIVPTSSNASSKEVGGTVVAQANLKVGVERNLPFENAQLRQRVVELERKLDCIWRECERVVGELTRIIERKNEIISKLELQIAGINFMSNNNNDK